eukprot:6258726-Prymnesium_polylepis.1
MRSAGSRSGQPVPSQVPRPTPRRHGARARPVGAGATGRGSDQRPAERARPPWTLWRAPAPPSCESLWADGVRYS